MGLRNVHTLRQLLEEYPDRLAPIEVLILTQIAMQCPEPESGPMGGKTTRRAGRETLPAQTMWVRRDDLAAWCGLRPNALTNRVTAMESDGIELRIRKGGKGMATVYRFPSVGELTRFLRGRKAVRKWP